MFGPETHRIAGVGCDLRCRTEIEARGTAAPEAETVVKTPIFDRRNHQLQRARHERSSITEKTPLDVTKQIDDVGFQAEAADLIADDDVGRFRKADRTRVSTHARDDVAKSVGARDVPREAGNPRLLDRVDARGAGPARKHPENSRAGREIADNRAGRNDFRQRPLISGHAMTISKIQPVLVDYPRHGEDDAWGSGWKPGVCAPPSTTRPFDSTHACAESDCAASRSRLTPMTRRPGIRTAARSITSASPCSRQLARSGGRTAMAGTARTIESSVSPGKKCQVSDDDESDRSLAQ